MTQKQEILAAFDDAWSHKWESIQSVLEGVTEAEAQYRHPMYANIESSIDQAPNGSILWHLTHLEVCYRHYAFGIRAMPEPPPKTEYLTRASCEIILSSMLAARTDLRAAIVEVEPAYFENRVWHGDTFAQFLHMIIRHDAWHSGQIAVARRLYRMSS